MNARERFLAVYDDNARNTLDRVPMFVQDVKRDFYHMHKSKLLQNYTGYRVKNAKFMAPLSLGFDAVFAGFPPSVTYRPAMVKDESGKKVMVGASGQIGNASSSFYHKGTFFSYENFEKVRDNQKTKKFRSRFLLKQTVKYFEKLSPHIFPVPMVGGIFDTMWMAMGMKAFSRNYRKKTKLYRELIRFYGERMITNVEGLIEATGNRAGIVNILDDVAFKGRPMIPPDRWEQDFGPYYKEVCSLITDSGMIPQVHTDGDITDMIPSFQKVGFHGLQGWEGGCDPYYITDHFPDFVVVGFGDVSETIPFGTKEEIYTHVKHLMDALKENRHFVLGPSTVIVKEMPYENVLHFMNAGRKYGKY